MLMVYGGIKKKKLAVLGTSVVLAMLSVVGVSAADPDDGGDPFGTVVKDTVRVAINLACTITSTNAANTYSATMTNGQLKSDFGSTTMTINCNHAGGWQLIAAGSGADASDKTAMNATGSGTDIATGTAISGATSNWAMKVTGDGADGFTTFTAVPSSSIVASGTDSVAGATLTTTYQVFISATQQADTYTGQVTYTLFHPQ